MRILSRPMFKYGGPIKEGVMHGMKNGGRAALVGNPVYPKTDGREHHFAVSGTIATVAAVNAARIAAQRAAMRYGPRALNWAKNKALPYMKNWFGKTTPASVTKGGAPVGTSSGSYMPVTINPAKFNPNWLGRDPIVQGLGWAGKTLASPTAQGIGAKALKFATAPSTLVGGLWFANGRWFNKKGVELDPDGTEVANAIDKAGEGWDPGAGGEQIITQSMKDKIAKDAQNKRLKSYLDMMGYDRSKRTAIGDALIDASAIVQDATTEAGSLKKADWGKMINKAIQTTSKRLDKPEQIREAVGLMMTKGAIEKDLTAETDALNKLLKTKQIAALDKSLAGETFKEVIAKKITSASGTAPIGKELATILRITEGIDAKVIPSSELKQGQDEVEFMTGEIAKANETGTPVPPGYYVISGRVLIVDETGNIKPYL